MKETLHPQIRSALVAEIRFQFGLVAEQFPAKGIDVSNLVGACHAYVRKAAFLGEGDVLVADELLAAAKIQHWIAFDKHLQVAEGL